MSEVETVRLPATVHMTFAEHRFARTAKYRCAVCKRRYVRTLKQSWTDNPFHDWQGREAELDRACLDKLDAALAQQACACGQINPRRK